MLKFPIMLISDQHLWAFRVVPSTLYHSDVLVLKCHLLIVNFMGKVLALLINHVQETVEFMKGEVPMRYMSP